MSLNIDHLATYISVVESGTFTAAAEGAGLTQPAISLQIKLLEQRLGVRLLERVGRTVRPTVAGEELLVYARRITAEARAAEDAMAPYRSGFIGRVRIGTGGAASIHLLPKAIVGVKKRMPGLEITVKIGNTDDILRDLDANLLDLAVVTLPASGKAFQIEPFFEDEMLVVAPKAADIPDGGLDAAFLCDKMLLLYDGGNTRRLTDDWMAAAGFKARPVMEFGSVEAIKELVAAGLGWSILPGLALARNRGANLQISSLRPRLTRQLAMVVRRDKPLTRGLREMMKGLKAFRV